MGLLVRVTPTRPVRVGGKLVRLVRVLSGVARLTAGGRARDLRVGEPWFLDRRRSVRIAAAELSPSADHALLNIDAPRDVRIERVKEEPAVRVRIAE